MVPTATTIHAAGPKNVQCAEHRRCIAQPAARPGRRHAAGLLRPRPASAGCAPPPPAPRPRSRRTRHAVAVASAAAADGCDALPAATPAAADGTFLRTVLPTALALMLCNMDRMCLSVAMVPIALEMGWAPGVQGVIQAAFLWGYLANQLLGGTLADRYGGKVVMACGVAFFSVASVMLPALAVSPLTAALGATLPAVLAARFLVGFGEGVALPAMNNLVATQVAPARRATALGAVFLGFHTGNLVALALSPLILQRWGWRALFYMFGALGAPLLALWVAVVPAAAAAAAPPQDGAAGASATSGGGGAKGSGGSIALSALLTNRAVWAIIVANFVNHWGYFIYLNWMPTYFHRVLGMDLQVSALMSFLPWLVMALGSSASGMLSDGLVARGVPATVVRKRVQTFAFLAPAAPLVALAAGGLTPAQAVGCMTAALGATSVGQFVTNMSDVAPRHAGRLFGLCNTFGSLAGILGVSVAGVLVERTGNFGAVFLITAALNLAGTVVWNAYCTAEKQFD